MLEELLRSWPRPNLDFEHNRAIARELRRALEKPQAYEVVLWRSRERRVRSSSFSFVDYLIFVRVRVTTPETPEEEALYHVQLVSSSQVRQPSVEELNWHILGRIIALNDQLSLIVGAILANLIARLALRHALYEARLIEYIPHFVAIKKIPSPKATDEDDLAA